MSNNNASVLTISTMSVVKIVLVFLAGWLIYTIRGELLILFIAILISSVVEPLVAWPMKYKIPKAIGIVFIYLMLFGFIALLLYLLVPAVIVQVRDLSEHLPGYIDKLSQNELGGLTAIFGNSSEFVNGLRRSLESFQSSLLKSTTSGIFNSVAAILGGMLSFVLVLVISFYLMIEEDGIKQLVKYWVPADYQPYLIQLFKRIQQRIGLWMRGYVILALIVFSLTFIALSILRVKYALVLSMIAALTEIIPFAGPLIAAVPAVLLTLLQSPVKALFVFVAFELINMVESHILVPQIMHKAIGLNPILVIMAILVGARLGGVVGALLAIPVLTSLTVFLGDVFSKKLQNN